MPPHRLSLYFTAHHNFFAPDLRLIYIVPAPFLACFAVCKAAASKERRVNEIRKNFFYFSTKFYLSINKHFFSLDRSTKAKSYGLIVLGAARIARRLLLWWKKLNV
jgi:hypothetical protein